MGMHFGLIAAKVPLSEFRLAFPETWPELEVAASADGFGNADDIWSWKSANERVSMLEVTTWRKQNDSCGRLVYPCQRTYRLSPRPWRLPPLTTPTTRNMREPLAAKNRAPGNRHPDGRSHGGSFGNSHGAQQTHAPDVRNARAIAGVKAVPEALEALWYSSSWLTVR